MDMGKEKTDILVVVDMQNDFINGSLGTKEAEAIVPRVVEKVKNFEGIVLATMDTHGKDYLQTQEGKNLPVEHCIKGTDGWRIHADIAPLISEGNVIEKPTFGSRVLGGTLSVLEERYEIASVTLVGLCTDICVISNAMIVKAYLPEVPIIVDATCCAGVSPESHERALAAMEVCQMKVQR